MGRVSLEDPRQLSSVDAAQRAALLDGFRQTMQGSLPQAVAGADWNDTCLTRTHQLGSALKLLCLSLTSFSESAVLGQVTLAIGRYQLGVWSEFRILHPGDGERSAQVNPEASGSGSAALQGFGSARRAESGLPDTPMSAAGSSHAARLSGQVCRALTTFLLHPDLSRPM